MNSNNDYIPGMDKDSLGRVSREFLEDELDRISQEYNEAHAKKDWHSSVGLGREIYEARERLNQKIRLQESAGRSELYWMK